MPSTLDRVAEPFFRKRGVLWRLIAVVFFLVAAGQGMSAQRLLPGVILSVDTAVIAETQEDDSGAASEVVVYETVDIDADDVEEDLHLPMGSERPFQASPTRFITTHRVWNSHSPQFLLRPPALV